MANTNANNAVDREALKRRYAKAFRKLRDAPSELELSGWFEAIWLARAVSGGASAFVAAAATVGAVSPYSIPFLGVVTVGTGWLAREQLSRELREMRECVDELGDPKRQLQFEYDRMIGLNALAERVAAPWLSPGRFGAKRAMRKVLRQSLRALSDPTLRPTALNILANLAMTQEDLSPRQIRRIVNHLWERRDDADIAEVLSSITADQATKAMQAMRTALRSSPDQQRKQFVAQRSQARRAAAFCQAHLSVLAHARFQEGPNAISCSERNLAATRFADQLAEANAVRFGCGDRVVTPETLVADARRVLMYARRSLGAAATTAVLRSNDARVRALGLSEEAVFGGTRVALASTNRAELAADPDPLAHLRGPGRQVGAEHVEAIFNAAHQPVSSRSLDPPMTR
ncbi:MAG: hypothetical protein ACOYN3_05440 [Acidimicrobiia bacterium]